MYIGTTFVLKHFINEHMCTDIIFHYWTIQTHSYTSTGIHKHKYTSIIYIYTQISAKVGGGILVWLRSKLNTKSYPFRASSKKAYHNII